MTWKLQVLGSVQLARDGQSPVRLGRKGAAALACVATQRSGVARSILIDRLWADRDIDLARNALRQWLFQLRRMLGPDDFIEASGEQVFIDNTRCDVDLWRFLDGAQSKNPERWTQAASLYRADFAQGLASDDAWIETERERIRICAQGLLKRMGERAKEVDAQASLGLARALLAHDPLDERTYRALMMLYAQLGMRAKSIALWHECRRVLRLEVGAEPSRETREIFESVEQAGDEKARAVVQPIRPVRGHAGSPSVTRDRDEAQALAQDYMLLATHHYFRGTAEDNVQARKAYTMASTTAPHSIDYAMCAAWTYFTDFQFGWNGNPDQNFAHCQQLGDALMRREADHPLAIALWGRLSLWQGDYRGAVQAFSTTVKLRPDDAGMLCNAADAIMRAGHASDALALVNRALQVEPGNRGVYHAVEGNIRFALGDLDGAMTAFEIAIRRHPGMCSAHSGLAAVLAELGRVDAAREAERCAHNAGNLRMSLDFARNVIPFADPGLRHRWVHAWQLAGVPNHEPRLRRAGV